MRKGAAKKSTTDIRKSDDWGRHDSHFTNNHRQSGKRPNLSKTKKQRSRSKMTRSMTQFRKSLVSMSTSKMTVRISTDFDRMGSR